MTAPRVLNKAKAYPARWQLESVYVGRPSPWGNPFHVGRDGTREEVIAKYRAWLLANPVMLQSVRDNLRGCDLVCWCAPLPCHADVLLEIANVP
jgi:hypothetical protein